MLKKAYILISLATFGFFGCSNDPISDLSTEETLVYITNNDKSVDFGGFKTFSIVDSVTIIENNRMGKDLTELDKSMLQAIITNMKSLGYTYVSKNDKPDVGIDAAWISNTYINAVSTPGYGGSYWGGGYGYGYPSYYQYYETNDTYWMISMIDFKHPDTANKSFPVIWNAQINGAGVNQSQYADTMINSIFQQSQYLKVN